MPCTHPHRPRGTPRRHGTKEPPIATDDPDPILERLTRLHPKAIDLSLDRVFRLLEAVGNPHDRLPPALHVAGTNGKGSTIAFVRSILEAHGKCVHVYTSPHLVRFNERVVVAGREIGNADLGALLEECEVANAGQAITFFEITTVAALLAFARAPADFVLLETGLGGRLDATNVLTRPALTAITPISMDHEINLGSTIRQIAGEKAGILKPGVRCVCAVQPADAEAAITEFASNTGAPLWREDTDWQWSLKAEGWRYCGAAGELPLPPLPGAFQVANAALALACSEKLLGKEWSEASVASGIRSARWPGRLQRLREGRLAALLPAGWELWLDGGHNPAAGEVIACELAGWPPRPLFLVVGMLPGKDASGYLKHMAPLCSGAIVVPVPGRDSGLSVAHVSNAAAACGLTADIAGSLHEAVAACAQRARTDARVLVAGSLYLVGEAIARNGSAA